NRAKTTVGNIDLSSILHFKICDVERAAGEADLSAFVFVNLSAGRHAKIPRWIESTRVLPMNGIHAGTCMWCADVAVALQRNAKLFLRRCPIGARPGVLDSGDASAVWGNNTEVLHDEQFQWRVGRAVGVVEISAHGLLKRGPHGRIAAVFGEARHDSKDRV